MSVSDEKFEEIVNDLRRDFDNIEDIIKEEDNIKVIADNDTLWEIFEVLFNGVENIEFNMEKNEKSFLLIKI